MMKLRNHPDRAVYASVDVAKFLCAWLVVTIHVAPFGAPPGGGSSRP